MPRRPNAFSLVELLVVLAMVAVLVAMLIPALRQARSVAHSALCLSNMRQQVVSIAVYANQNKDFLPPHGYSFFDHNMWTALIRDGTLNAQYLANRYGNSGSYWEAPVLLCPAESVRTVLGTTTQIVYQSLKSRNNYTTTQQILSNACDSSYGTNGVRTHYGDNGAIPQNFRPAMRSPWPFGNIYSQHSDATFVADGILNRMSDIKKPDDTFFTNDENRGARYQNVVFRHTDLRMNTSYADGHANSLRCEELDMDSGGAVSDKRLLVVH